MFCETLAKRQGWTVAFAEIVFLEYRKFLFLTLTAPQAMTPPAPVQAALDLHRESPEWSALPEAAEIEQRLRGGDASKRAGVEAARRLYALTFGQDPPESIWPARVRRKQGLGMIAGAAKWVASRWGTSDLDRLAKAVRDGDTDQPHL